MLAAIGSVAATSVVKLHLTLKPCLPQSQATLPLWWRWVLQHQRQVRQRFPASACVGSAVATVSTATGASACFVLFRGGLVSLFDRSRTHRHRRQQRLTGGVALAQLLFGGNGSMNLLQLLREASIEYR